MAKPGPRPGTGGRPRKGTNTKPDPAGYKRMSVGRPGSARLEYVHDVVAGVGHGLGRTGRVVDHKNGRRADDSLSNLRVTTRSVNRRNQHPKLTPHKLK